MPKRVIFRNRSFITFVDRPVLARSNALGLLHPSAISRSKCTEPVSPDTASLLAGSLQRLLYKVGKTHHKAFPECSCWTCKPLGHKSPAGIAHVII